jgi:hypothetical protein
MAKENMLGNLNFQFEDYDFFGIENKILISSIEGKYTP